MATRKRKATKKKVAKKKSTGMVPARGRGRPPGSKSVLPQGTAKPIKLLSGLPDEVLQIPEVKAAIEKIKQIMQGKHRNRHVQTELQACSMVIEFYAGKPKARHEHDTGPNLSEMLAAAGKR